MGAGATWSALVLRARVGLSMLQWRALRLRAGRCPLCGPTLFVKLAEDPLGVRCVRCAAWPAHMALAGEIRRLVPDLAHCRVYEASSEGPWVDFLRASAGSLTCSEYWEDAAPGDVREGVVCQDLEALTFADASFDVCTHTEVLEHVADDAAAFAELHRVLAPGGWLLFTVPLFDRPATVERASREPGGIVHHLPPEYHDDRIRGAGRVLVLREYGRDVVDRLRAAGFESVEIRRPADATGHGHTVPVVVARRPAS